jgi:site-specific recombinase XerD
MMATKEEIELWSDWINRFLQSKQATNKSPNTLISYTQHLNRYLSWLAQPEQKSLALSEPETIEAFIIHEQAAGYSAHTVAGRYRALRVWYNYLVKRIKAMPSSPLDDLDAPGLPNKVRPYVTLSQYQRLFDSIRGETWVECRDRCILYLLYWCGLRISELTSLRHADVDVVRQQVVVVQGKGGQGRLVPCGSDVGPMLRVYLMKRPLTHDGKNIPGNPLFVSNNGAGGARSAITGNGVRQMLRRRCKAAALPYQNPHRFRHGYAMLFLNNGMQLSAVSDTMGHASEEFTRRFYAHWLPEGIRREYAEVRRRVASGC